MRPIMRVVTIAFPHNKTMKEERPNGTKEAGATGILLFMLSKRWKVSTPHTATKCNQ